jgi:diguanylate cyclase (GGDEF)-like protein
MAASDPNQRSDEPSPPHTPRRGSRPQPETLSASALEDRLAEEINRAGRWGTSLSCLLVAIEELQEIAARPARELREQAVAYAGPVLGREVRCFDRVGRPRESELLVVLPGADSPRGEVVARRLIDRLRAIKIEAAGVRQSLRVSVGLAAWREDLSGEQLVARARAAVQRERNGGENDFANDVGAS